MLRKLIAATRRSEELEKELERMKAEIRNHQQIVYLKKDMLAKANAKIRKLEKDCYHIEQAFENYVNEVEEQRLREKIEIDMVRAQVKSKMAS